MEVVYEEENDFCFSLVVDVSNLKTIKLDFISIYSVKLRQLKRYVNYLHRLSPLQKNPKKAKAVTI